MSAASALKLLFADDEDGIRLVMGLLLRDMGYAVTTASRGDEALDVYRAQKIDIVVSDIKMPGKDGIALLREIKAYDPDAEVLLLTGHGDMDLAVSGLRYGAGDFLNKPVSDAALEVALDRAKQRIALREALRRHTEDLEALVASRTAELVRSERFAAVGESAAVLSHAIKNIAGALEGTMFVLEKGLELDRREYFEQGWQMIRGDVARLRKLAVGLLDLGKPPALVWRPAPPAAPAVQVCASLGARAKEAGVALECIDEAGGGHALIPSEDVYQCLLNLAVNALEACAAAEQGPGARVTITTRRERAENGQVCTVWQVRDNGAGMNGDAGPSPKADEAFCSRKDGGSGIGLFATRRTAREMGAELEFTTGQGDGTLAELRLCDRGNAESG